MKPTYHTRSKQTQKRVDMYKEKPKHDSKGKLTKQAFQSDKPQEDGRILANRKYFANTRISGQNELDKMREVIARPLQSNQVIIRDQKLPITLLQEVKANAVELEKVEPFDQTFGPKAIRKQAKISLDPEEIMKQANQQNEQFCPVVQSDDRIITLKQIRGQSQRVYGEIYKVIDSSDVIVYVLDARDVENTLSNQIIKHLRLPENRHRHLIYVLNKVDLVPVWCTKSWIQKLQKERPTIAFCSTARKTFGKAELISVFRQFSQLLKDKKQISIGFCGAPNVGKSSVINALIGKEVCNAAPIPGETKVWQYVNLTKRIFLIDSPGVVFPEGDIDEKKVYLQGIIRSEFVPNPEMLVDDIIHNVKRIYINKIYQIEKEWETGEELIEVLGRQWGRLNKGNEVDTQVVSRRILEDYCRGKLPHFVAAFSQEEVLNYNQKIQQQKLHIQQESDSAIINYQNKQKLNALTKEFQFESSDDIQIDDEPEEVKEKDQSEQHDEDSIFSEDELEGAFNAEDFNFEKRPTAGDIQDIKADVKHAQKKQVHQKAIKRTTKLLKTKDRELIRAANSGVVNDQDLDLVIKHKKLRSRRETTGGFKGTKTGSTFYADVKARKQILQKITGKKI